ncbi:MAG TPA: RNA polymerase sigma factor [Thermoanaerobaculia bacterium]|nr:RNA polymerase sigma factor [Thermoanaerobaculia bacterium]
MKTDLDFLNMVRRGDPAGATGLFEKYADALLRFADRMLSNRGEAEEVTQEVFLKMITRVEQYDGRAAVSSWLFAIAANACRDRMRRNRRAVVVPLDAVAEPPSKSESVENRIHEGDRRRAVRRALSKLSDEQREALVLARYHGMPYAEIARTLQITEGAVKTRIFRAMETLKEIFSEGGATWNAMTS